MITPIQARTYRRMMRAGYVPILVGPKPIANAVRTAFGLPPYRVLGSWLPPREKAA